MSVLGDGRWPRRACCAAGRPALSACGPARGHVQLVTGHSATGCRGHCRESCKKSLICRSSFILTLTCSMFGGFQWVEFRCAGNGAACTPRPTVCSSTTDRSVARHEAARASRRPRARCPRAPHRRATSTGPGGVARPSLAVGSGGCRRSPPARPSPRGAPGRPGRHA